MVPVGMYWTNPNLTFTVVRELTPLDIGGFYQERLSDIFEESFSSEVISQNLLAPHTDAVCVTGTRFTFWATPTFDTSRMVFGGVSEDSPLLHVIKPSISSEELETKQLHGCLNLLRN